MLKTLGVNTKATIHHDPWVQSAEVSEDGLCQIQVK